MKSTIAAFVAASLLGATPAAAEIVETGEHGFSSVNSAVIAATPEQVWQVLIAPQAFWNPEHSWSGDAANFHLDARAGGCFCESLPAGGSVEHLRVIYLAPGHTLRLSGVLGPLQSEAMAGTLTVELTPVEGGTQVEWSYVLSGFSRIPLSIIMGAVDAVMAEQLDRLAAAAGGAVARPDEEF